MRRLFVVVGLLTAVGIGAGVAFAAFFSTTSNAANSFAAKRIFPSAIRATSAWDMRDASGGSAETNISDALSYADAVVTSTANWANTFASNRYVEFDFSGPLAAGLGVSSAVFNFRMAANASGDTACFYFEVYLATTSTLLATYGSSGSPVACNTGTTQTTYSTAISQITSTDTLNDLRIRVYGKESGGKPMKIDQATVTGTAIGSFTLYEKIYRDQADTSQTSTAWSVATSGDGVNYLNASNWQTTFSTSRYLKFTFDPDVPTGAVITYAHLKLYYHSNTSGDTACWYFETYNGATLLGSHGSSGTPQSCQSGNTTYSTDDVALSELTSVTDANNLTIKAHFKESGSKKVNFDLVQLNLNYYLD